MMRATDNVCDVVSPPQASFTSTSTSTQEPQPLFSRWPAKQSYASPWHSAFSLPRPSHELHSYIDFKPSYHPPLYLQPLPSFASMAPSSGSSSSSRCSQWDVDTIKATSSSQSHQINYEVESTTTTTSTEFTTSGHETTCTSPDSWGSHALSSPPSSPNSKLSHNGLSTFVPPLPSELRSESTAIKEINKKPRKLRRNRLQTPAKKKSSEGRTCEHCRAPSSPAWRRGPSGWLCNRCGLRYHATLKSAPRNVMALSFVLN